MLILEENDNLKTCSLRLLIGFCVALSPLWGVTIYEESQLSATDGASGDRFGHAISIENGVAAIGAPFDDDNGINSGAAFLFDVSTGEQIFKLLPSDGEAGAEFGFSIALGNGIVAVGARAEDEHGLDVLSQRMDSLYQSDNDSAIWCGETALHIADSLGLDSMQVSLHSRLGFIHKSQGEMYRAMRHYEKAAKGRTVESKDDANRLLNLGDIFSRIGEYEQGVKAYQQALQYYETQEYTDGMVEALLGLGYSYQMIRSFDKALAYYRLALRNETLLHDPRIRAGVFNSMANGLKLSEEYDSAMVYYDKVVDISIAIGDKAGESGALNNLAGCYVLNEDYPTALELYRKTLGIKEQLGDIWGTANCLNNSAIVYKQIGQLDSALSAVQQGLKLAEKSRTTMLLKNSHQILADVYSKIGLPDSAYVHLEKAAAYKDSLMNETMARQIAEMEAKYQSEKKERENAELRAFNLEKIERLRRHRLATAYLVFALILLVGVMWFSRYRHRMTRKVLAQENEILRQADALHQKQEDMLKQQVEHRDRELTTKAMAMVKKNDFLLNLVEDIEKFSSPSEDTHPRLAKKLIALIRTEVNNNDEWEEFRIWYEETSGAFLSTLNEKYPDLSPLEIKLAALIRLLLSTKDIAGLLGREIATVEKGRYRLRKKLKLEPNENLTKFLLSI